MTASQITSKLCGVKQPLIMLMESVGQEFRQGTTEVAFLYSTVSGAPDGRPRSLG